MNNKSIYLVMIITFFINGCKYCNELSQEENIKVKEEIHQVMLDFEQVEEDWVTQNIEIRADVEEYVEALNGEIVATSHSTIREGIETFAKEGNLLIDRQISDIHIYPLSINAASCTFLFTDKILTPQKDTLTLGGNFTFVFKKFEDKWKVVQEGGTNMPK